MHAGVATLGYYNPAPKHVYRQFTLRGTTLDAEFQQVVLKSTQTKCGCHCFLFLFPLLFLLFFLISPFISSFPFLISSCSSLLFMTSVFLFPIVLLLCNIYFWFCLSSLFLLIRFSIHLTLAFSIIHIFPLYYSFFLNCPFFIIFLFFFFLSCFLFTLSSQGLWFFYSNLCTLIVLN